MIDLQEDRTSPAQLALGWMAVDHRCRVLVTDRMKIVWANRICLEQFARRGAPLQERQGYLVARDSAVHERLSSFVQACPGKVQNLLITSKAADLLLQAVCLSRGDQVSHVGIAFLPDLNVERSSEEFAVAYGLTPSEQRVLKQMLSGQTAANIAQSHAVSIDTIRSHIRHIYEKVNVSSRESLFSRLAPFAAL